MPHLIVVVFLVSLCRHRIKDVRIEFKRLSVVFVCAGLIPEIQIRQRSLSVGRGFVRKSIYQVIEYSQSLR